MPQVDTTERQVAASMTMTPTTRRARIAAARRGLTLIEIIVVMAIVAIVMGVAVVRVEAARRPPGCAGPPR